MAFFGQANSPLQIGNSSETRLGMTLDRSLRRTNSVHGERSIEAIDRFCRSIGD
jgi:hypothetical protein